MEFLSLEKEPEPRPPRFGTTEAIVASLVIHALTLLLFLWLPSHLPEPLTNIARLDVVVRWNNSRGADSVVTSTYLDH